MSRDPNNSKISNGKISHANHFVLAFDIGLKRTGVAAGQSLSKTSQPAGQIQGDNGQLDWLHLKKIFAEWQPTVVVIGDPRSKDPHLNKLINRFKSHIQKNYKTPIVEINEELTSAYANTKLQEFNFNTQKKISLRDQIAACLILDGYFNSVDSI